jgi:hypothetical protein
MKRYNENFEKLVLEGITNNIYIGIGNPNAKILFVGKEGSMEEICPKETSTAEKWAEAIKENRPCSERYSHKFKEGHTWKKYQKLHDFIFPTIEKKLENEINFVERIFATEMNVIRKKTTKEAQKESEFREKLQKRKNTFFKSDFIQQFPVVVLACSNYITNYGELREIDDIFNVEYVQTHSTENAKRQYHFYTHYNKDKSKLVIHTRQLSGDVPNELLEMMGNIIRNFVSK